MEKWPKYNKKLIEEERIPLIVCINGKQRDEIDVEKNTSKKKVEQLTFKREKVKKYTSKKKIKKIIFIRRENYLLINIVV